MSAPRPASTAGKLERIRQLAEHGLNTPRIMLIEVGSSFDSELRRRLHQAAQGDELMTVRTYHPTDEITYAKGPFAPEIPVAEAIRRAEELSADWNVLFQEAIDVNDTLLAGNLALSREGSGHYEALAGRYRVREVEDPPPGAEDDLRFGSFAAPGEIGEPWVREAVERVLASGLFDELPPDVDSVLLELNVQAEAVGERAEQLLFWEWRPLPRRARAAAARAGPVVAEAHAAVYGVGVQGLPAPDDTDTLEAVIGGKAAGLRRAHSAGLPVPPYIVLPGEMSDREELARVLSKLRSASAAFFADARPRRLAVRSSPAVSMPGMLDTVLAVEDETAAVAQAVERVLASWDSERAVAYRRAQRIPDDAGLAVLLQPMVRADEGAGAGGGVGFTRRPATGADGPEVEFVEGETGLSLVSGDAVPLTTEEVAGRWPWLYRRLADWSPVLERAGRDMQEFEFAVERGAVFLLQTRPAKRSAAAALRVAYELAHAGVVDAEAARAIVGEPDAAALLLHRLTTDGAAPAATGRVASPGVAVGRAAFDGDGVDRILRDGDEPILLVDVPSPDDYPVLRRVTAVVSSRGGITSHASVVALGAGIVAVVGCRGLEVDRAARSARLGGEEITEGDWLSVEAQVRGEVHLGKLPLSEPSVPEGLPVEALSWARSLAEAR